MMFRCEDGDEATAARSRMRRGWRKGHREMTE